MEGWQNGYCAALEKLWEKSRVGSNPTPSAGCRSKNFMFNVFKNKKEEDPKSFKELLIKFKEHRRDLDKALSEIEGIKKQNKFSIQKTEFLRYNPFKDVGGNQSFSIVLLDANNSGVVITSLYSREGNRVYAKSVVNGSSDYSLSKEEKQLIEKALNS